ncbi:MAG: hypothetical protein ACE5R4_08705 [Armatimonadota bacterium]
MIRKLIVLSVCVVLLAAGQTWAQEETISLRLTDTPVEEALRAIQQQAPDFQYTLHADTRGNITLNLPDVSVATAVRAIAAAVGATYRLDQGVYVIEPEPEPVPRELPSPITPTYAPPLPPAPGPMPPAAGDPDRLVVRPIKLKHADPADIALIFGGTVVSSRMGQLGWGGVGLGLGGYGPYGGGGAYGNYGGPYGGGRYGGQFGGPAFGGPYGGRFGNRTFGGVGGVPLGGQWGNRSYGGGAWGW